MFLFLTSLSTPERIARLKQILEGKSRFDLRVVTRNDEHDCVYVETSWTTDREGFVETVLRLLAEAV